MLGVDRIFSKVLPEIATTANLIDTLLKFSGDLNVEIPMLYDKLGSLKDLKFNVALEELAGMCANKAIVDTDWALLSGRLLMQNIYQDAPDQFSKVVDLYPKIHLDYKNFVKKHAEDLDAMVVPERDLTFDMFSVATLRQSYLWKIKLSHANRILETPQYLFLRVATFLHYPNLKKIKKVYDSLSQKMYIHSSATLFNAGNVVPQMSACFLMAYEDTTKSIYEIWKALAIISKNCGGIGVSMDSLRHSITDTGEHDDLGIIRWLQPQEKIIRAFDQSRKRSGSATAFLNVAHVDIYEFIDAKDDGPEELRASRLYYGLMVPDLFMRRVLADEDWSLFCPNIAKGLFDTYGEEYEKLYVKYELEGKATRKVKALELWKHIINMQIKKGMPFIIFSDAANKKSNQQHSGLIRSSNLCTEILEVVNKDEIASCNIASLSLNKCVSYDNDGKAFFDFSILRKSVRQLVENLNQAIDRNYYPDELPQIRNSNFRHRPIGIGVQGMADTFALLNLPWVTRTGKEGEGEVKFWQHNYQTNPETKKLNYQIFEAIYYYALEKSAELARRDGPYASFYGSPASKGILQPDLWTDEESKANEVYHRFTPQDWESLREKVKEGLRNSLLVALMPTATSAHLLGNAESFEPFYQNIYTRMVLSGQRMLVNKYLVKDLKVLNFWNDEVVKNIIQNKGSVANIHTLLEPEDARLEKIREIQNVYRTVFEIPQRTIIELSADRGKWICQTQSMNLSFEQPTFRKINAALFYAWKRGLKTGTYYLRQPSSANPTNFTIDSITSTFRKPKVVCTDDVCIMCQS